MVESDIDGVLVMHWVLYFGITMGSHQPSSKMGLQWDLIITMGLQWDYNGICILLLGVPTQ